MVNNCGRTVYKTVQLDLCVSCGICKAICPYNAIKMIFKEGQFVPSIDWGKCQECGKCYRVCPGLEVNYSDLYGRRLPVNIFTGNTLKAYIGYAKDKKVRFNGSSGGVVTSILINLLKKII